MRIVFPLLLAAAVSGCGSTQFKDTNAAVDTDPLCASRPDQPNEPVSLRCERKTETIYSTERKAPPLDLSGKSRDKDPR